MLRNTALLTAVLHFLLSTCKIFGLLQVLFITLSAAVADAAATSLKQIYNFYRRSRYCQYCLQSGAVPLL